MWKDVLCSWVGRINVVKVIFIPKTIYRYSAISFKITSLFITGLEKTISTSHKTENPRIAETIMNTQRTAIYNIYYMSYI